MMRFFYCLFLMFFCLQAATQDLNLKEINIDDYSLTIDDLEKFVVENKDNLCSCWLRDSTVECNCMPTHKFFLLMVFTTVPPIISVGSWLSSQYCFIPENQCIKNCDQIHYENVWRACINGCPPTKNEWANPTACKTGIGLLGAVVPWTLFLRGLAGLCAWPIEKITGNRNKQMLAEINKKFFHGRDKNSIASDDDICRWGKKLMKTRSPLLKNFNKSQTLLLCKINFSLFHDLINENYFPDEKPLAKHLFKLASIEGSLLLEELNSNQIAGYPINTTMWEILIRVIPKKNQSGEIETKFLEILKNIRPDIKDQNDFDAGTFIDQVIKCGSVDKAMQKFSDEQNKS